MRAEVMVRCIGIGDVGCCAAVDPERGGAWCRRHRPLDLTGGVAPSDTPAHLRGVGQGWCSGARRVRPEMLEAWVAQAKAGHSTRDIATRSGRLQSTVQQALHRAGLRLPRGPRPSP